MNTQNHRTSLTASFKDNPLEYDNLPLFTPIAMLHQ